MVEVKVGGAGRAPAWPPTRGGSKEWVFRRQLLSPVEKFVSIDANIQSRRSRFWLESNEVCLSSRSDKICCDTRKLGNKDWPWNPWSKGRGDDGEAGVLPSRAYKRCQD